MSAPRSSSLWGRLLRRLPSIDSQPLSQGMTVLLRALALALLAIWMLGGAPVWIALLGCVLGAVTWCARPLPPPAAPASAAPAPVAFAPFIAPACPAPHVPSGPNPPAVLQPRSQSLHLPETFDFEYSDAEGVITQRTVIVRSAGVSAGQRRYLSGTCTQAHAHRTFRLDRITGPLERTSDGVLFEPELVYQVGGLPQPVETNPSRFRSETPSHDWQTAVVFAGFSAAKRQELEALAEAAGWQVRTNISKTVNYLVVGGMVGSKQLDRAGELGVEVLDEAAFWDRV